LEHTILRILNFRSGFGITANYLAKCYDLLAIKPNRVISIIKHNHAGRIIEKVF